MLNRKSHILFVILMFSLLLTSCRKAPPANPTYVFWCELAEDAEYSTIDNYHHVVKVYSTANPFDSSKPKISEIAAIDGHLIDGHASAGSAYCAVREVSGNETVWKIVELNAAGEQTVCRDGINDPQLMRVLAYYEGTVYYVRHYDDGACCRYVSVNEQGSMFEYGELSQAECFCGTVSDMSDEEKAVWGDWYVEASIPLDYLPEYVCTSTVSLDGKIALEDRSATETGILYITRERETVHVGAGRCPVWLNQNILLFLKDNTVCAFDTTTKMCGNFICGDGNVLVIDSLDIEYGLTANADGTQLLYVQRRGVAEPGWPTIITLQNQQKDAIPWSNPFVNADSKRFVVGY